MIPVKSRLEEFREYLEKNLLTHIFPEPTAKVLKSRCRKPRKPRPQNVQLTTLNAKPISGTNENRVNPVDGREQILTTSQWPYSVHGVIAMKFKDAMSWGTGTLIGPNIVLTAGHNLYNYDEKTYADLDSMQFLPGINSQILPFGVVEVEKYYVSPVYIKEKKEDYGILILKKPIGEMTGYFGLACLDPTELENKRINITGYPGDKVASKPKTYEMWGMEGSLSQIYQDSMYYLVDTAEGQSGSGIYYEEDGEYFVCGVHAQGGQTANIGTLITRKGYQQIYEWIQENTSKLFLCLRSPYRLNFHSHMIGTDNILLLFEYDVDDITSLFVGWKKLKVEGAQIIAKNTSWINLSNLHLSSNNIGDEEAKAIGQNTSWTNLSELYLSDNNIGDEGAKIIGQNTSWNLSCLDLSGNKIGDDGAKAIGHNTSWVNLSELYLSGNNIGDEGAKAIGQNTSWVHLSHLYLSVNNMSDEGAKMIGQNTSWINLSKLDLGENKINDEGAKAIGQNTSWINLSKLYLYHNNIGDEGVKAIGQNTSWVNLSHLDLSENDIGNEGAKAVGQNTLWINLSHLDLSGNKIGHEGANAIGQNTSWINLSKLCLSKNKIGDEGAKAIGQNASWINLSQLSLTGNKIGDEGVKFIAQNTSWPNLSQLYLEYNNIGDDGAQSLAQKLSQTTLSELNLEGNQISDKGAKAFSQTNIKWLNLTWNNMSSEGTRALSNAPDLYLNSLEIFHRTSTASPLLFFSIWRALENSSIFDKLRITFSSHYRSVVMDIIPAKIFEDFMIDISHVVHSRLDFNRSLMFPQEEDEIIEELDCNSDPHLSALYGKISIEEGLESIQNSYSLNLNSSNLSAEEVQPSQKNIYINSS